MGLGVQHLSNICKTLGSISSITKSQPNKRIQYKKYIFPIVPLIMAAGQPRQKVPETPISTEKTKV
jgi:hypothetical protein